MARLRGPRTRRWGRSRSPTAASPRSPSSPTWWRRQREDSVGIDFDPVDGAVDYRVYPLPEPTPTITVNADGSLTIDDAIYRCAGLRQTLRRRRTTSTPTRSTGDDGGLAVFNPPW